MSFTDVCCNFACGMGKFIGGSLNVLASARKALGESAKKLRPLSSRKRIQSIVTEELIRLAGKEAELTRTKLEERLQVMAETIEAIQKEIAELSACGFHHETLVSAAIASVEGPEFLSDEERAILASIFRQNIAIQKPDLIDTAVEQSPLGVLSS